MVSFGFKFLSTSSLFFFCFFFSFVAVVVVVVVVVKMAFGVTDGPLVCYHQVEVVYMN